MTPTDLEPIERLLAKATPSPWEHSDAHGTCIFDAGRTELLIDGGSWPNEWNNRDLIVALVNAAPSLIAEVKELRAKRHAYENPGRTQYCLQCERQAREAQESDKTARTYAAQWMASERSLDMSRLILDETARERNALLVELQAARAVVGSFRAASFAKSVGDDIAFVNAILQGREELAAYDAAVAGKDSGR